MALLKEKLAEKQGKHVIKIDTTLKSQLIYLMFFSYCIFTGCGMKLPNKIHISERMEDGSYHEKEILNQDSIRQVIKILSQKSKEAKVKFYMQYNVELIYSNMKINFSVGGKYMKSGDGKFYQLKQPDSLLQLLQVQ